MALLATIARAIASIPAEDHGIDALAARLAEVPELDMSAVWLLDASGQCLERAGPASGGDAAAGPQRRVRCTPPMQAALRAAVPLAAVSAPEQWAAPGASNEGWLAPLLDGGAPVGLLYLRWRDGEGAGPWASDAVAVIALQVAQAIGRIRVAERAAAQRARLALVARTARALAASTSMQALCETLAETIRASMGHHITGVYLREGDTLMVAAYRVPGNTPSTTALRMTLGVGIVGHVAATNEPYLCVDTLEDPFFHQPSDTAGSRAEIAAPMYSGGEIVGVLNVESTQPHAFNAEDLATLVAIADQAAIAVQNARLYEREAALRRRAETRAQRLEHIQRVGQRLKMDLDEQQVGMRVVQAARDAMGFRMAVLNLFDRPGEADARARVVATAGLPPEGERALRDHDFAVDAVLALFHPAYRVSHSYCIPAEARYDVEGNEVTTWTPPLDNAGEDAWRSGDELLVPLTDPYAGHLLGFLSVDDPESGKRPEREDIEVLEIFADQAVVALRNATLLAQARRQAERDSVTGLLNHRGASVYLEAELHLAARDGAALGLIMLDLDNFKLINDTHGHPAGDRALHHLAQALERSVEARAAVARLGGDEFLVILPGAGWDQTIATVQRILACMQAAPLEIAGAGTVPLQVSAGIAVCPDDARQAHTLLGLADSRLYEAKRAGVQALEPGMRPEARDHADLDGFDMLSALTAAVDNKDRYTRRHSEQVAAYACLCAEALGLSRESQRTLRIAGLLHDVGKIGVPDRVLRKPGALDPEEWETMKQHVTLSATLLRTVGMDGEVLAAVAHHHERWDGYGYPAGLAGAEVPLLGRIMIVADAASAMASDRPYRKGLPLEEIVDELRRGSGRQFDPDLLEPFIAALRGAAMRACEIA